MYLPLFLFFFSPNNGIWFLFRVFYYCFYKYNAFDNPFLFLIHLEKKNLFFLFKLSELENAFFFFNFNSLLNSLNMGSKKKSCFRRERKGSSASIPQMCTVLFILNLSL